MNLLSKVETVCKEEGVACLLRRASKRLLAYVFETNSAYWFERNLSENAPQIVPRVSATVDFSCMEETVQWLGQCQDSWVFNAREVEIARRQSHYFPSVRFERRIVGCAKVGVGRVYIHDYKRTLALPEGCAFIYDTYVLPEYRGLGLAAFLVSKVMEFLRDTGFQRVGCHIPPWNGASLNLYAKLGFKKTKYVHYTRLCGLKFFTSTPGMSDARNCGCSQYGLSATGE